MTTGSVILVGVNSTWTRPCQHAIVSLNDLFTRNKSVTTLQQIWN